ncbi:hypothetical protein [Nocardia sp. SC052]|uniref:hypothetical protein n=1 Tax=Nocardia sichangensis TaxID=3385975 RepID=UPI0039A2F70D
MGTSARRSDSTRAARLVAEVAVSGLIAIILLGALGASGLIALTIAALRKE